VSCPFLVLIVRIADPCTANAISESENSQLIARPLARLATCLYASPDYLERSGEPDEPNDLTRHECLGMSKINMWTLHDGTQTTKISVGSRFVLNNIGMIRRLATLGMGIILMSEEIAADDLANGRLRRLLPQWQGNPIPVYAVTETRLLPAKTQRFIEFLRERLGRI
jgi:DNA-binding transcriptional LysR family regulator